MSAALWRMLLGIAILSSGIVVQMAATPPASAGTGDQQRIAYLDQNNNVWSARTDGSDQQQLTTQGGFGNVRWSHDGTRILATGPYEGGTGVYLLSPDPAFDPRSISSGRAPAWSPDSSRFAFIEGDDVHIFDRDGGYQRTVETGADELRWSPDGSRIGFTRIALDPFDSGCAIRQLGWIDASSGAVNTGGSTIGTFAWNGDGTGLLHRSASDGTIRSQSVTGGGSQFLSSTSVNPCGAPFFTTPDGERLLAMRWFGEGNADLVVIDLESGEERLFSDVPVSFPASRLPNAYVTVDHSGRYVNLARSYPTDIHRLDLETGQTTQLSAGQWRQLIGFAPEGDYYSLLNTPSGRATELTIHDLHEGRTLLEDVGWMGWQPSPVNKSAALAWDQTWAREDRPVAAGEPRTWTWGPEHFDVRVEEYDESPGGYRAVRYYDKSRMEITNPGEDRSAEWYVTNGLLVNELITGRMQVGDGRFIERDPAEVPVAGDPGGTSGPTYATLQAVLDAPATEEGQEISQTIDQDGQVGDVGPDGNTAEHFVPDTEHTVADVFWDYLNSEGAIWDGEEIVDGLLFDPTFFATGFPITEAYWTNVEVGGEDKEVLLQCFERRCLTYTPDNPEGWQVEMGNVGRHYHEWRH